MKPKFDDFIRGDKVAVMDNDGTTSDAGIFIDYTGNGTLIIDGFFGFIEYDISSYTFKLINDLQYSELKSYFKAREEFEFNIEKIDCKMWEIINK